ncbi:MAG: Cof-type HAD-IIB family hydrolase [Aerococcus sp.]|nr:Cof-type HAD-IIB family hydrolase [Aerococcus sp.]
MIQLVAFDIDGTLLNDEHQLVPSTEVALKELKQRGIEIVINSGRPYPGVKPVVDLIGAKWVRYVSCFNGGLILDLKTNETLYQATLNQADIEAIAKFANEEQVDVHIYGEQDILIQQAPRYQYAEYEAEIVHMGVRVHDFVQSPSSVSTSKVMITANPERIEKLLQIMPGELNQHFEIMRSAPFFLEFTPKNVDKGNGLHQLADKLNIAQRDVMAFGDNENDLSMLKWAGVGVAMGNAPPVVRETADTITDDNNHDGIMNSLRQYIFHAEDAHE